MACNIAMRSLGVTPMAFRALTVSVPVAVPATTPTTALPLLDQLLSIPSILSTAWLEGDPRWDPLRTDPAFLELLNRHRVAAAP